MKKLLILLLSILAFTAISQAQTTVVTYRVEGGPDTFFVVDSNVRVFPNQVRVVEEVWRPVIGRDSLKSYLATLENLIISSEAEIDIQKATRKAAKDEVRRIKKELEASGGGKGKVVSRTVPQPVQVLENPGIQPPNLAPGEYIWDGQTWTPKAKVKKIKTSKAKS
jgi:hypothetical protein